MKETVKTSRTAGYLEKMFRALNAEFFNSEIEEPIITIQSTPRAYGHVTVNKTWKRKEDWKHELNIGAENLNRPIENLCATIVHEMVHLYNIAHNVQDCSRGGSYHNKKFKDEAEKRGLKIEHHEKYGWTITEPGDRLIEFVLNQNWTEIDINRGTGLNWTPPPSAGGKAAGGNTTGTNQGPKKTSTRKYICPTCGQSIRATKTVNIICGNCMEHMQEA